MASIPHDIHTFVPGIYEALLDEGLRESLARHPELRTVLAKQGLAPQISYNQEITSRSRSQQRNVWNNGPAVLSHSVGQ